MHRITLIAWFVAAFLGGAAAAGFVSLLSDEGCGADPLGCPVGQPQPDEGCIGDPNGKPGCAS